MYKTSDENRKAVLDGLKRRADRHEQYEHDMISACNRNSAAAKAKRASEAAALSAMAQQKAERSAKARAKIDAQHKAEKQEQDATRALRLYCLCVIGFLWLTTWTYLPMYAAITTCLALGACVMAYIYRVFVPFDEGQEVAR